LKQYDLVHVWVSFKFKDVDCVRCRRGWGDHCFNLKGTGTKKRKGPVKQQEKEKERSGRKKEMELERDIERY